MVDSLSTNYPDVIFRNGTDRLARAYLMEAQRNVGLYDGSIYVSVDYRPSLFDHVDAGVNVFLNQPEIMSALSDPDNAAAYEHAIDAIYKYLLHDDDENIGEPQTFQQKFENPLPKKIIDPYKQKVVVLCCSVAQKAAILQDEKAFKDNIIRMQDKWRTKRDQASKGNQNYEATMNDLFNETLDDLTTLDQAFDARLNDEQKKTVSENVAHYINKYNECENETYRREDKGGLLAKIVDKGGDTFYVTHGKQRLLNPSLQGALIERENSNLLIKTVERPFDYLPSYVGMTSKDKSLKGFATMAVRVVVHNMVDYMSVARPVVAFVKNARAHEPDPIDTRRLYLEHMRRQIAMVNKRRADVHPLQDDHFMTREEIAAKLLTFESFPEEMTSTPLIHQSYDRNFVECFDKHLQDLKQKPHVPRHEIYTI